MTLFLQNFGWSLCSRRPGTPLLVKVGGETIFCGPEAVPDNRILKV